MAAETDQVPGAILEGLVQVEGRDGTGRALAQVAVHRDQHRRAEVPLHQARSHDADDPLVPGIRGQHDHPVPGEVEPALDHGHGLCQNPVVNLLAAPVLLLQPPGHGQGVVAVLGGQQGEGGVGVAHAAGGVEAGGYDEDDVRRFQLAPPEPGRLQHGHQSGFQALAQALQAEFGQDAVLPGEGDDVGDGAQGHQVQVLLQLGVGQGIGAVEGLQQLVGHAHPGQLLVGIGAVLALGVEHRHRPGQALLGLVVIGDDAVDPQAPGVVHLGVGGYAAVHRQEQAGPAAPGLVDSGLGQAVTVARPVGKEAGDLRAELGQSPVEEGGAGDAVDVVVAVDHDGAAGADRLLQALHGRLHPGHQERVVQVVQRGGQEYPGLGGIRDAPGQQQPGDQR